MLDRAVFERFVGKEEKDAIAKQVNHWLDSTQKYLSAEASSLDPSSARKDQEGAIEQLVRDRAAAAAADAAPAAAETGRDRSGGAPSASGAATNGTDMDFDNDDDSNAFGRVDTGAADDDDADDDGQQPSKPAGRGRGKASTAAAPAKPAGRGNARGARGGARGAGTARGGRAARGGAARGGRQTTLNVTGGDVISLDEDSDGDGGNVSFDEDEPPPAKSGSKRAASSSAASRPKRSKAAARTYDDEDEEGAPYLCLTRMRAGPPTPRWLAHAAWQTAMTKWRSPMRRLNRANALRLLAAAECGEIAYLVRTGPLPAHGEQRARHKGAYCAHGALCRCARPDLRLDHGHSFVVDRESLGIGVYSRR